MGYSDLCIRSMEFGSAAEMGRRLGLDMIAIVVPPDGLPGLEEFIKARDWRKKPAIAKGVELRAGSPGQLRGLASRLRRSAEVLVAIGGTEDMNRAAVETQEIDMLIGHIVDGRSGINHVLARLARKNGVAVGFEFGHLLESYRMGRVQEMAALRETAMAVRRFKAPYQLTSGAQEPWGMRGASELVSMGRLLGFTEGEAKRGLTDSMVRRNRKRLSGKWVMPGVEVE
jgi:ribonuclease P/MRP protein subunit RPP1